MSIYNLHRPSTSPSESRLNRKILILKENSRSKRRLSLALASFGYDIRAFVNPEDATRAALRETFDLVIADSDLPERKTLEVIEELKQIQPGLPVFLLAHGLGLDEVIRSIRLGVRDIIDNPEDIEAVIRRTREFLRGNQTQAFEEVSPEEISEVEALLESLQQENTEEAESDAPPPPEQDRSLVFRMKAEIERLKIRLRDQGRLLQELTRQNAELIADRARPESEEESEAKAAELATAREEIERNRAEITRLHEEAQSARTELEAAREEMRRRDEAEASAPTVRESAEYETLLEEFNRARENTDRLQAELDQARRERDEARDAANQPEVVLMEDGHGDPALERERAKLERMREDIREDEARLNELRDRLNDERSRLEEEVKRQQKEAELSLREYQTRVKEEELKLHVEQAKFREERTEFDQIRKNFQDDVSDLQQRQAQLREWEERLRRLQADAEAGLAIKGRAADPALDKPRDQGLPTDPKTWAPPPIGAQTSSPKRTLRIGPRSS
ncbi:MAG: response regulator [Puniceicoccaceae bacterium]|nr:MAG: response regulator [Puniceicoccaceae bacterium]